MLSSYHFRGSKRYPALLRYVVNAALEGRGSDLKERTLGVEVFGRDPDYDTNTDPVVRISAGEVRKRIAQYYHENQETAQMRIELPLGSYAPEFLISGSADPQEVTPQGTQPGTMPEPRPKGKRKRLFAWIAAAVLLLAASAIGGYSYYRYVTASSASASEKLLGPLLKLQRPILIVVGTSHPPKVDPETPTTSFNEHTTGPYHHVSLATAIALSNVAGILRQYGRAYEVKEDTETSLTDIHSRPVILIGATNNVWTMRLVSRLRYRFIKDRLVQLQDTKDPQNTEWSIDFSTPYANVTRDFAMVARYHDATTEGPVLIVAGVGPYGTEAASDFISSFAHLDELQKKMPAGWENKDFEVILRTDIIDSKAGPPAMIAQTTW
ncbi:MAG: hypothetical protein P4L03_06560 [Terracidiphilus sp.]|nr:hypothetical protein [Terracidiphilus sp.]